ncbi:MAG: DNA-3-methyladenine glycosylase [Candidatus Aenigmatarchaeota archaeon]
MPLSRDFYERDAATVARGLLGKVLIKDGMSGTIVETEAYYGEDDPASHAFNGETERNRVMFGEPGRVYVYLCYGVYHLLNITTHSKGRPGAVLIRALEPREGLDEMKSNRGLRDKSQLTSGPGKLTQAMDIDLDQNGVDVTKEDAEIRIERGREVEEREIDKSSRIGISHGQDRQLRFFLRDSEYVS